MECALCDPTLGPIIAEGPHWRLVLNHNQNVLGKCFLVTRRHLEAIPDLGVDEWLELHRHLADANRALRFAFRPDHFNYAFLQNQDRHAHLHIIPRYAGSRTFGDTVFNDPGAPGHYEVKAPAHRLGPDRESKLVELLGRLIGQVQETIQR